MLAFNLLIVTHVFVAVCYCLLFNENHVLHLISETITVRRRLNMIWMIYECHMIPGDKFYLNFPTFVLQLRKTLGKISTRKLTRLGSCCCFVVCYLLFNGGHVLHLWSETVAIGTRMIYDEHIITGDECDPIFLTFILWLRENPGKKPQPGN